MKEFLEQHGYKMWKEDVDTGSLTQHFQKRIDNLHKYADVPVCECNEKLFINVDYWEIDIHTVQGKSCTIYLVHENKNGDWCDLKIYSIPVDKMKEGLAEYEDKIVKLWKEFANERG